MPCCKRSLWDTGRPPRVSSLTQVQQGSAWADRQTLASRGTINQETEKSSTRAVKKEPQEPPREATRGPEAKDNVKGLKESQGETTNAQALAEGESNSNLANDTTKSVKCEGNAEGENLANETSQNTIKTEEQEQITKGEKRKQVDGISNEGNEDDNAKKVKIEGGNETGEKSKESAEGDGSKEKEVKRRPTNPMEVAVVLQGYPESKMTKSQANGLEAKLVAWLKKSPADEPVQFLETNFEDGVVIFTCGNEWTKKWLMDTVSQLDAWAKFEAGPADIILYGARLILWVSKLMKKRETQQILELLEKQNKGMSTKNWRVVERKDLPKQASLIMWIDEDSHKFLKERKFRIHLGLGQATFKPVPVFRNQSDAGPSRPSEHRYVSNSSTRGRYRKYVYPKPPPLMHLSVRMPNTQAPRGYSYRGSNPSYGRRYPTQRSTQYYSHRYMSRNSR